jgi:hypothetical protein
MATVTRHRIVVHHLPSGSTYYSDPNEHTADEIKELKDMLAMGAAGKTTYIKFAREGAAIYISSKILQESVLKLEPVG